MPTDCPFCDYAGPSMVLHSDRDCLVFEPLRPIVPGHVLVVPRAHATDFAHNPSIAAAAMRTAGEFAQAEEIGDANIITSKGLSASQTVRHVHLHIIPRHWGDEVTLPWRNPNPSPLRRATI